MDRTGLAADLATAASVAVVVLVAAPYALLDTPTVATYYEAGIVGPQYFGIAAVVAAVALRSARTDRSDPATVAGVALALTGIMGLLAVVWALAIPADVLVDPTTPRWLGLHRWLLALTALVVPALTGIYANDVLE